MRKEYNKVVRDNIPNIIKADGETPTIRILTDEDFSDELNKKLLEEIAEYNEAYDIMELVDVVEVIYGILKNKNISIKKFEKLRKAKYKAKGGFEKGIYLESVYIKDKELEQSKSDSEEIKEEIKEELIEEVQKEENVDKED